jgi:[protein-PII] uridylyltransferase
LKRFFLLRMTSSAHSYANSADVSDLSSLQGLREQYREAKARQMELLRNPTLGRRSVRGVLHHFSELADGLLRTLWQRAQMPQGAALLAVGGYGRAQLFPYSDIDVLVLLPQSSAQPAAELAASIEQFISSCWDAGLEIGSSVRSIAECLQEAAQDLTVQTAMLESRRITGSKALFADFEQQFRAQLDPKALSKASCWRCASATPNTTSRPIRWSPTARNRPAGCAICTPCSGWPRPQASATAGMSWPSRT